MADVNQKKLLEGIGGKGIEVGIRSLAKFMACAGVLVTPHVGRMRGYVSPVRFMALSQRRCPSQVRRFTTRE